MPLFPQCPAGPVMWGMPQGTLASTQGHDVPLWEPPSTGSEGGINQEVAKEGAHLGGMPVHSRSPRGTAAPLAGMPVNPTCTTP